jgi:hypothetical protein
MQNDKVTDYLGDLEEIKIENMQKQLKILEAKKCVEKQTSLRRNNAQKRIQDRSLKSEQVRMNFSSAHMFKKEKEELLRKDQRENLRRNITFDQERSTMLVRILNEKHKRFEEYKSRTFIRKRSPLSMTFYS